VVQVPLWVDIKEAKDEVGIVQGYLPKIQTFIYPDTSEDWTEKWDDSD
jgi:hypothetical protein